MTEKDLFVKAMEMLAAKGVVHRVEQEVENVGSFQDTEVKVFRNGNDDNPFMAIVFDKDGDFDYEI